MATKRKTTSESVVAPAAPVRAKSKVTRKHATAAPAEVSANLAVAEDQPVVAPPALSAYRPTFEEIAQLAYSYWEARGYQSGSPDQDWLRAEQELCMRMAQVSAH
jgi:hypothetical protein